MLIQNALHDFIADFVSEADLTDVILPTIEKAVLRSPEVAMGGTTCAFVELDIY